MPDAHEDITDYLELALRGVERAGEFAVAGRIVTPLPDVRVPGVGPVALPLQATQATALAAIAERAPYGRGEDTLVDPAVRRAWQLDPATFEGVPLRRQRAWRATLGRIVRRAARGLGVEGRVRASLYKLLLYEPGDFFVPHRDTEKAPGMFGTLVVSLPAAHEGGALVVRHAGAERRFELRSERLSQVTWAAFYADCLHEVEPLTAGHRLVLVYNLVRPDAGPTPRPPETGEAERDVASLLRGWATEDAPVKVVCVLEHRYTEASLSFAALKGRDAAVARVLVRGAQAAGCAAYLALASIRESGSAEPRYESRRRWRSPRSDDGEAFDIIEVDTRVQAVEQFVAPDGAPPFVGPVGFELDEVSPPGAIDEDQPDEQSFHEATGNEGGSFERAYRRAAIVVWPHARELAVLAQGGPHAGVARLATLIDAHDARSHVLASALVARWVPGDWHADRDALPELLRQLARLADGALVRQLVAQAWPDDALATPMTLPEPTCAALGEAAAADWATATWLEGFVRRAFTAPGREAVALATAIIRAACQGDTTGARCGVETSRIVAAQAHALGAAPEDLARLLEAQLRLCNVVSGGLAMREEAHAALTATLDALLAATPRPPEALAAMALALDPAAAAESALARVRATAIARLEARVALPLAPPADWARDTASVRCTCENCRAAATFLADPRRERWTLKAREDVRRHVERHLAHADVRFATLRGSSPLTLEVTKTTRSYEARVVERRKDFVALGRLRDSARGRT